MRNRKLVGLSREVAERALADSLAAKPVPNSPWLNAPPNWQILCGAQIDYSNEREANTVARTLIGKSTNVVVRIFSDGQVLREMEAHDLRA
ncbi:hypothetical protein [Bradyrhizobium sp. ARR65]|uniref:hypothetical protein n=1 Tax=Bradyrhizobium sp. ARR65 TaxID=1040989 RepID=UPI000463A11D|nr:hypothetical protein [Bradyrhizobium sp. ARR65]